MLRSRVTTPLLLAALMLPLMALIPSRGYADDNGSGNNGYGDNGNGDDGHGDDDEGGGAFGGPGWRALTATVDPADFGKVMSGANGVTTFRMSPSGTVTVLSGDGARMSPGTVRFRVSLYCNSSACDQRNTSIAIGSAGAPTGRLGLLDNFTLAMDSATLASGPLGTNPIIFNLGPIGRGRTATFYVGADVPVYGDDSGRASGPASSPIYLAATNWKGGSLAVAAATLTAQVFRRLSVSQTTPLSFGTIVRPVSGAGTMVLDASSGSYSVTGGAALPSPAPGRGAFLVTGEGGQMVSISVAPSFVMTNGSGGTLTVTTSNSAGGSQTLSNAPGSVGSYNFYVGGALDFSSATATGVYSGTYTVNVAYN
jgi:hypothetical protein